MSEEEYIKLQESTRKLAEELEKNPEKALEFLVNAGIATPEGKLAEKYK